MGNLVWGLQITALGMGLVFALLALLWGLLTLVRTLDRETPTPLDARAGDGESAQPSGPATVSELPPEGVAAIVIAVLKHREVLYRMTQTPGDEPPERARPVSPWLAAGRVQQNTQWQWRGR
jgi:Na+-transporting methylmalonyl-CoA/oxaloacetate decarboxylase gamma subunit